MNDLLLRELYASSNRFRRILEQKVPAATDSICDPMLLGCLFLSEESGEARERIRMTDISRYLMITKPAVTHLVKRLTDLGYVTKSNDPSDKRVTYIELTEAGRSHMKTSMEERMVFLGKVTARMGEEKMREMLRLLDGFFNAMTEIMEEE